MLVFDPTTGQTLFAKNADQAAPIASITKLMTAMVVLDAKLPMDEAIEITAEDIDLAEEHALAPADRQRTSAATTCMRLALMASDNRAASALGPQLSGRPRGLRRRR